MKFTISINKINYENIIEKAIPMLKEKAQTDDSVVLKMVSGILNMPGDIPRRMLNALPQDTKDELVVYLANNNKEKILNWIQESLLKKGIEIEMNDLAVEK